MIKRTLSAAVVAAALLAACTTAPDPTGKQASFKDAFADDFLVGAAINKKQIWGDAALKGFIAEQFNALTAENEMKWVRIQPQEGRYDWSTADKLVEFTQANNIHLTGHTLLWHQQTPDWVFEDEQGNPATRELLLARLKSHIFTVVGRYKGQVPSWDVVNEALNDDGTMRESKWYQQLGPDYLIKAFDYAHQADPQAKLYYNDYNLYLPQKRQGAIELVKQVQQAGIPVHGIGMQGHYGIGHPQNLTDIEDSIVAFSSLGEVLVTELDVSVLPFPEEGSEGADLDLTVALSDEYNPYVDGLPKQQQSELNDQYLALFDIYLKHKDKISRVTFWGVDDAQSWRNNWPVPGRTDYPLLIDRNRELKPVTHTLFDRARSR